MGSTYVCNDNQRDVAFTLYTSFHSAWEPSTNFNMLQCSMNASNDNGCRASSTPCFNYRSLSNTSYCAPAVICSILEFCNNNTYTCQSNSSVCVINSCCSPQAVCLPPSATNFCNSGSEILLNYQYV